jgi:hypothetical protein
MYSLVLHPSTNSKCAFFQAFVELVEKNIRGKEAILMNCLVMLKLF